ncbi:PREDICTED: Fanconi anemia group F protein [Chinchilla lanigera]|uniref:Fanconi anemia group F protein n=1 Tax=Chinchilla lanigera TaxID=34839 RepID=UPI0006984223|nr:PREDICTED: Fanconi anemia group F protein [Chinchilla lanigera]
MEPLLQQVERFSEVLSVSRSNHVSTWGPETVRRALQWARYLRHVYRRFGGHGCIRTAVERRLRSQWGPEGPGRGLTSFQALGRGDVRLSVNLLQNRALGDAAGRALLQQLFPGAAPRDADAEALQARLALLARRRAALLLLRETDGTRAGSPALPEEPVLLTHAQLLLGRLREAEAGDPGGWLGRLWTRAPRDHFLQVTAVALLQPPDEESGPSRPESPGEESHLLVRWLLERSEVLAAFCRLPAGLLTSVAARHPALFRAYLGLLTDWGRKLHYDLQKGAWVAAESQDVPWEELFHRFQSLGQAPPPLKDKLLTALEACKAQDGDFEVPGLSIWTDLLLALQSSA